MFVSGRGNIHHTRFTDEACIALIFLLVGACWRGEESLNFQIPSFTGISLWVLYIYIIYNIYIYLFIFIYRAFRYNIVGDYQDLPFFVCM